MFIYYANEVKK